MITSKQNTIGLSASNSPQEQRKFLEGIQPFITRATIASNEKLLEQIIQFCSENELVQELSIYKKKLKHAQRLKKIKSFIPLIVVIISIAVCVIIYSLSK